MVPGKRKVIPVKKLEYTHLMKYEKTRIGKSQKSRLLITRTENERKNLPSN